jgi:SAM-dependent methyltransferase
LGDTTKPPARPYKGAASYYSRFRPPYPPALVNVLGDRFGLDGSGRLLDLGCGPGSVAIPLAQLFEQVVAADREPDMLAEGRTRAAETGVANLAWVRKSSEDLSPELGVFRLVTMGESFHWMDRKRTLDALYELVSRGGGIAIVGRGLPLPLPPMTPWRAAVCKVVRSYVGDRPLPWDHQPPPPGELHQAELRRSRFVDVAEYDEQFDVEWTIESLIGNLYSMSFCNREGLGERAPAFERDLKNAILAVEPSGILRREIHQFFALMAFKR